MKCRQCGYNLEIDTEICPCCGIPNPVAKKHRADMRKYTTDYAQTKEVVISKSRRINTAVIRITVIVVTIAAMVGLICYGGMSDKLRRDVNRRIPKKEVMALLPELDELIEAEDYMAVHAFNSAHKIYKSLGFDSEYTNLILATNAYSDLLMNLLLMKSDGGQNTYSYASSIGDEILMLSRRAGTPEMYSSPERFDAYLSNMEKDVIGLLYTYLGITETEYRELLEMTATKRAARVEEIIDEIKRTE